MACHTRLLPWKHNGAAALSPHLSNLEKNMKCPTCPDTTLVMTDRQGVEIDYCPTCRGIWLDRGELDKLLDRAAAAVAPAAPTRSVSQQRPPDFKDSDYRDGQHYQRKPHKSWLNDFFD